MLVIWLHSTEQRTDVNVGASTSTAILYPSLDLAPQPNVFLATSTIALVSITKVVSTPATPTFVHAKCPRTFTTKCHLNRPLKTHTDDDVGYHCHACGKFFNRKDNLNRHLKSHDSSDYLSQNVPRPLSGGMH
ncbi:hypothetical protein JTE90_001210 [Oedothorax gibbosus]|uniref:C2H2-type domain-containing protein n=1 Tax=Oedothorax gibbosus TaxID=931172 RepID=A0AAV6UU21_9ARAC|nr:hypothetical protein JTE90_001210 [Oedothorax gibbosus]